MGHHEDFLERIVGPILQLVVKASVNLKKKFLTDAEKPGPFRSWVSSTKMRPIKRTTMSRFFEFHLGNSNNVSNFHTKNNFREEK